MLLACVSWADVARAVQTDTLQASAESSASRPEPAPEPASAVCPKQRRALAVVAALVPGVVLHGSGHYVQGCGTLAQRLLFAELAGLGLVGLALAPAAIFGGNAYLVPFQALTGMVGVALIAGSWLLDLYGSAVPMRLRGGAANRQPLLETVLGYRYVYEPVFETRHFMVQGFDLWSGAVRFMPRADIAPTGHNARYRLPVAWRLFGATPTRVAADASHLDVVGAFTQHAFTSDGFSASTVEVLGQSRFDFARFDPLLRGSFGELGAGVGMTRYAYEAPGAGHDYNSLLLMGFAVGAYFGDPNARGGEAKLYYDHRHDDFAAGLKLTGLGSGALGHFGFQSRAYHDRNWGLMLDAQVGSAYVLNLSLLFRQGGSLER